MRSWGWGLHNGISALIRRHNSDALSLSLSLSLSQVKWEGGCLQARKRPLTRNWPCCTMISDFQPPKLWEIIFCYLSQSMEFCYGNLSWLRQQITNNILITRINKKLSQVSKKKSSKLKMGKIFEQACHKEEIHKANIMWKKAQNH